MSEYLDKLERVSSEAPLRIAAAVDQDKLEALRLEFLGRKGTVTEVLHSLGLVSPEERPLIGQRANELKKQITELIESRRIELERDRLIRETAREKIDVTLPGLMNWPGAIHPLNLTLSRIIEIFFYMGFTLADGPEVEDDFHNFDALNTPADHPARDVNDTFYLDNGLLLRSHTSPVQVRHMQANKPPLRILAPGRVFRRDTVDASHSPVFHQIEGLYVDEHVTFGDLKYTLEQFAFQFFGPETKLRFRPIFFPLYRAKCRGRLLVYLLQGRRLQCL